MSNPRDVEARYARLADAVEAGDYLALMSAGTLRYALSDGPRWFEDYTCLLYTSPSPRD